MSAAVIAITNQKGGVGKTTSVSSIGAALARMGKRVILIDLDPQGNLSSGMGAEEPAHTIQGALFEEYDITEAAINVADNLVLIPATYGMANFETEMNKELSREYVLRDKIAPLKEMCDFILLDCPPSLGLITINAMTAADSLYVPVHAQKYSIDGLNLVIDTVKRIQKRINPDLKLKGTFFTQHNGRKLLAKATVEELSERLGAVVMKTTIRTNVALQEAPSLGQDIFTYDAESNGAKDYLALTKELLKRF